MPEALEKYLEHSPVDACVVRRGGDRLPPYRQASSVVAPSSATTPKEFYALVASNPDGLIGWAAEAADHNSEASTFSIVSLIRFCGQPVAWRACRLARKEKRDAPEVSEAVSAGVSA